MEVLGICIWILLCDVLVVYRLLSLLWFLGFGMLCGHSQLWVLVETCIGCLLWGGVIQDSSLGALRTLDFVGWIYNAGFLGLDLAFHFGGCVGGV